MSAESRTAPVGTPVEVVLASMDEETYQALLERMGDVPLELRLALLFLQASGADGDVADEELQAAAEHLAPVLEQLGSRQSPEKVLRNAARRTRDEKLLETTIVILAEVFPQEVLASIASQLQEIVGADDDVSEAEQAFVDGIIERWQIEAEEAGEDEDEESDEEESDEEEDDEESDEEDEEDEEEAESDEES